MADVTITRELGPARGRYVATLPGADGEAELTFVKLDGNRLRADHTLTPVTLRGRGIASALVERMVADARREGFTIVPVCPFVVALFDQRADWADVRST